MAKWCDEHSQHNCTKWHDPKGPTLCRRCEDEPAGAEGLCYPCRYYRS